MCPVATWLLRLVEGAGLWGLALAMVLDGACLPLPSELILPLGGFLAAQGRASLWSALLAANLGLAAGSLLAYLAARWGDRPLLAKAGPLVGVDGRALQRAEAWFQRYGDVAVFAARLVPGLRTLVSVPAGLMAMPVGRFLWYTFLGSLPWSFALIYAGYLLGHRWDQVRAYLGWLDGAGLALALFALALGWWLARRARG